MTKTAQRAWEAEIELATTYGALVQIEERLRQLRHSTKNKPRQWRQIYNLRARATAKKRTWHW